MEKSSEIYYKCGKFGLHTNYSKKYIIKKKLLKYANNIVKCSIEIEIRKFQTAD